MIVPACVRVFDAQLCLFSLVQHYLSLTYSGQFSSWYVLSLVHLEQRRFTDDSALHTAY